MTIQELIQTSEVEIAVLKTNFGEWQYLTDTHINGFNGMLYGVNWSQRLDENNREYIFIPTDYQAEHEKNANLTVWNLGICDMHGLVAWLQEDPEIIHIEIVETEALNDVWYTYGSNLTGWYNSSEPDERYNSFQEAQAGLEDFIDYELDV